MHENTSQVKLNLETNINVCTIDRWAPPQGESTVWNLVQTRSLSIRELLVAHRLLEARRFLPKKTLPCGEVSALEQRVLENSFDPTKSSDNIDPVVVELP